VAVLASQPRDSGTTSTSGRARYRDHRGPVWRTGPTGRFSLKAEDNLRVLEHVPPPTLRRRPTWWTGIVTLVRSAGKTIAR
jgi:hypothetical protein